MTRSLLTVSCAVLVALVSGCWNGVPFQVDLSGKMKVDYPEGHPDRSVPNASATGAPNTPAATAAPVTSASAQPQEESDVYADYDIPGQAKPNVPSVLQPRGQEPQYRPMYRDVHNDAPLGRDVAAYFQVTVRTFQTGVLVQDDPRQDLAWTRMGILVDAFGIGDGFQLPTRVTIRSFDGSWVKSIDTRTNGGGVGIVTHAAVYKPLYAVADLNGRLGYSKPFVMTPNEKTLTGHSLPVRVDIPVVYNY